MPDLRPQLSSNMPPRLNRWFNEDGTPTLDAWRFFEHLSAMLADDAPFALQANQAGMEAVESRLTEIEAGLAAAANQIETGPRGELGYLNSLPRQGAEFNFAGVVAFKDDDSADWVKSSVSTPSKAAADYETLTLETDDFYVAPGDRIEVFWSYKNQGVLNMYEHFSHAETVELLTSGGTVLATLNSDVYPAWAAANTGYIPSTWSGEVNIRHAEEVSYDAPDPFTGSWPDDGLVKVKLTLAPSTAASGGGTDCINGGTFNAANIKTYFKCVNRRLRVRVIPEEITDVVG